MTSPSTVQERRQASIWTRVHPVFALGQLGVFLVSVALLASYGARWVPFSAVHLSVLLKIALMIGAIVTGSLWEHDVFGKWWFAHEFLIEDVMTANVFFVHVVYLVAVYALPAHLGAAIGILIFAYVLYALNVGQYIVNHVRARSTAAAVMADAEIAA